MFCSKCGTELVNGACPSCEPQNAEVASSVEYVEFEPKKKKNLALAIVCMITGIASVVLQWGLLGGIAALITGSLYKKKYNETHPMVTVGKIFGVIGIIVWAITIVCLVAWMIVVYSAYFALIFAMLSSY